jgi:hypothetical protein
MVTFIEALNKSINNIDFGWNPEPGVAVSNYNIYVGLVPGTLTKLVSNISSNVSNNPENFKKIGYSVNITTVQSALSLLSTFNFANTAFYWAITYVSGGSESSLTNSTVVFVPPVGIMAKTMREDPAINRHLWGFSDDLQQWIKASATLNGALITSASDFYSDNIISKYTYDTSGNMLTALYYKSDMTYSGSPAKLVTYTYNGSNKLTLKAVTDSTVA